MRIAVKVNDTSFGHDSRYVRFQNSVTTASAQVLSLENQDQEARISLGGPNTYWILDTIMTISQLFNMFWIRVSGIFAVTYLLLRA